MRHRSRALRALSAGCALALLPGAALPTSEVSATVTNLRSEKGQVMACLTARPKAFPKCERDANARAVTVPAARVVELDFGSVPAGRYAIAIFHDENENGRLDKRLLMPREGFGFSRNAPVGLGPPSFGNAAFTVSDEDKHQSIRMRYLF